MGLFQDAFRTNSYTLLVWSSCNRVSERNRKSEIQGSSEDRNTKDQLRKKSQIQILGFFRRPEHRRPAGKQNPRFNFQGSSEDQTGNLIRYSSIHAEGDLSEISILKKGCVMHAHTYTHDTEHQMRKKSEIQFLWVFGRPEHRTPNEKKIRDSIFRGLRKTGTLNTK